MASHEFGRIKTSAWQSMFRYCCDNGLCLEIQHEYLKKNFSIHRGTDSFETVCVVYVRTVSRQKHETQKDPLDLKDRNR